LRPSSVYDASNKNLGITPLSAVVA